MRKLTLELWEAWLVIKDVTTHSDVPEFLIRYWPICPCSAYNAKAMGIPIGSEMMEIGTSTYIVKTGDDNRRFELRDGGRTVPVFFEKVPAEYPGNKKIEHRWSFGQWQKYLKRKGWVLVPFKSIP